MYLKSLELAGFKSFAKKATLQFTSPITGIVGPNGSGKSNIAEAFQFVLGEQSIKSLRGKRGEDLIWNGGGDSGRANRGNIKLTFDNSHRIFSSIDFDEVTIERVVNRDNSNEYLLNGTQVRLKDIIEVLALAHVGATGHHIISQGEADRILTASIRERREMIEDALGLKIYQWKKLESTRKLEKTEENMKQVESLRREIAPHIKFLKKQVEKIEKSREMRNDLIALYKEYFFIEEDYINSEKKRLNNELDSPTRELADLDSRLEKAKKILTDAKERDVKSHEVINVEEKLTLVRKEKDSITRELGRLEGEINANYRLIEKERKKNKRDEFKTVYLKDLEEVVKTVESYEPIDDVKRLYSEIMGVLRAFIAKHRAISDSSMIGETERDIVILEEEKSSQEKKLSELVETEKKYICEYEELKKNIEKEKDTNRDAEKDVFKIIARQNELRGTISGLTGAMNAVIHDEDLFKRELAEAENIAGRESVVYEIGPGAEKSRTSQEERRRKIERIKIRLEDSGLGGSQEVMKEYKETEDRDAFLARELEDLEKAKKELFNLIADLDERIDHEFKSGLIKINDEFNKFFNLMFGGGKAELSVIREVKKRKKTDSQDLSTALNDQDLDSVELNDSEEEGLEGLEVNVSLPRKKVKGLMMLSGGERALTSIALLFAISQVNPPPFIILDETDAALDEANSRKYGDMIESLAKNSQLILITHNRETMSRAGVLYGVTMGSDGASKLLSIAFEEAVAVAK